MQKQKYKGRVVVVTGAAKGIGKDIARLFGRQGAQVIIDDVDRKQAEITMREFKKEKLAVTFFDIDLREVGAGQRLIAETLKLKGQVDVLINNARSKLRTTLATETEESWDEAMAVNLKAHFFAAQAAMRAMKKQGSGSIVNISSVAGRMACHESPTYHVSKAGLIQMTRYLAVSGGKGVRVNCVLPGFIVKDEHQKRYRKRDNKHYRELAQFVHPLGRVGSSQDVSQAVNWLCSEGAGFITGQVLVVDGGLTIQEPSDLVFRFDKDSNN